MNARPIPLPAVRIMPAHEGGWLVVAGKHGWLCGDRRQALAEKAFLDRQWERS
jgi:hypothetical protein